MSDPGAAAVRCFARALPLFFSASPKTPLRVLAIAGLDTVHTLSTSAPLPRARLGELALMLDFQAWTNAAWDGKALCPVEYRAALRRLEMAGLGGRAGEYLGRIGALEGARPPIGGDRRSFDACRAYREEVARVSLATVAAIALETDLEDAIEATRREGDVNSLFRMAMLCQIVDDAMDYLEDRAARLPSFLTSTASLSDAVEWTAAAARSYGAHARAAFPLRVALRAVAAVARAALRVLPFRSEDRTADPERLQDLPQRRSCAEGRHPHDSGGDARPRMRGVEIR